MSDSFKKEFDILRELGEQTFVLRGSAMIVEILPKEEVKTASGLIMESGSATRGQMESHKVEIARVLMCGEGYWAEGAEYGAAALAENPGFEPLEVGPGAIILLPQYSAQILSSFPGITRPTSNKLAMVKFDQVMAYYPSEEAYASAKEKLNK